MMRFRQTFGAIVDVMQVDHQTMRLEVDLRR
jgi:hypothetical protein